MSMTGGNYMRGEDVNGLEGGACEGRMSMAGMVLHARGRMSMAGGNYMREGDVNGRGNYMRGGDVNGRDGPWCMRGGGCKWPG